MTLNHMRTSLRVLLTFIKINKNKWKRESIGCFLFCFWFCGRSPEANTKCIRHSIRISRLRLDTFEFIFFGNTNRIEIKGLFFSRFYFFLFHDLITDRSSLQPRYLGKISRKKGCIHALPPTVATQRKNGEIHIHLSTDHPRMNVSPLCSFVRSFVFLFTSFRRIAYFLILPH